MSRWIYKRLLQAVLTIVIVVHLTFFLIRLMPGNPIDFLMLSMVDPETGAGSAQAARLIEVYTNIHPQKPLWEQYIDYMTAVFFEFDLGTSIHRGVPVTEFLLASLPWTLFIMSFSLVMTFVIGILLGGIIAYYEGSNADVVVSIISTIQSAVPFYVAAVLLLYVFGYRGGYFPVTGRYPAGVEPGFTLAFIGGAFYHAFLPMVSMIITGFAGATLSMRGNAISVLGSDYIRVARLRGLNPTVISTRYVIRNAILPMYTGFMLTVGYMFGGSVILEEIFFYRGIGYWLFHGVISRDYPIMMGGFILITIAVVIAMIVADVTYDWIDPRAKGEGVEKPTYRPLKSNSIFARIQRFLTNINPSANLGAGPIATGSSGSDDQWLRNYEVEQTTTKEEFHRRFDRSFAGPVKVVWADWRGKVGILLTSFFVLLGLVGPYIVRPPHDSTTPYVQPFETFEYPLGSDRLGQGLHSLMVYGTAPMLEMIVAGGIFTIVVGVLAGAYSGYTGGITDRILMVIADVALSLPGFPLIIVLAAIIEPESPWLVGIILSIAGWGGLARAIRSEILSLRGESYVESSRTMGISRIEIIWHDLLPNLWPYILINLIEAMKGVIFGAIALYFLGVLPFSHENWGVTMNLAYANGALQFPSRLHWILVPIIFLTVFAIGLVLLAQSLDRVNNPRIRIKHLKTVDETNVEQGGR